MAGLAAGLAALAGAGPGCRNDEAGPGGSTGAPAAAGSPWFADVTDEVGLDFVHDAGKTGDYFMPQQVGSGAALFDGDGDGRLDIYLLQNAGPGTGVTNRLYRQTASGRFEDVTAGSGLDIDGHNMGVAAGDLNNDGRPDVVVTQYGGLRVFLNRGGGRFEDVSAPSGVANPTWGTSAALFDYDRDGWLDLVVVNYVDYDPTWPCQGPHGNRDYCAPKTFKGRVTRLFRNLGGRPGKPSAAGVRFEDVTDAAGLGRHAGPGLGVLCADFDGDGWPDIFVANDGAPNHLWINQKNSTFTEQAVQRNVACNGMGQAQAGMGIACGDVDGDGLAEVFVTHLAEEDHTLWRQKPRGLFQDRTAAAGLANLPSRGTGFGTTLADFDQDGALDLAIVNGRVSKARQVADWSLGPFWSHYGERNQLLRNDGAGRFTDVSAANRPFCDVVNVARGLARGDIDGDGSPDLLVTTIAGRARLFKNVAPGRGHWLGVRACDPQRRGDAYGAEVTVRAAGRTQGRVIQPGDSYLCSSEPAAHFGLGALGAVDALEVLWPDGTRETFPGCAADQKVQLTRGGGRVLP